MLNYPIDANTKLMGLIGQGISYSLSPLIHNRSLARLGINAVYLPFDTDTRALPSLLESMWRLGALGFNVTVPHKAEVARILAAKNLGSINTVYRGKTGWQATSTDALGLEHALRRMGYEFKGFNRFVILGNGGASLAVIEHLAAYFEQHGPEVFVLRRKKNFDEEKLTNLYGQIKFLDFTPEVLSHNLSGNNGNTLLLQATDAPRRGDDLSTFTKSLDDFHGVMVDMVYGAPSALLQAALQRGLPAMSGEPMLIEQARLAQKLWWSKSLSYEEIESFLAASTPAR